VKIYDELNLLDGSAVVGQHGVWLPDRQIKVPFQWGGQIQKYQKPNEQRYNLDLIGEEVALLRVLAERRWAPPIGEWVYFRTVVSEHPGAAWWDPCGAYGYEMADAQTLPPGQFDYATFREAGLVTGTPGAWNDLNKPGNVVNGYLIDVRRSGWDRLRYTGPAAALPRSIENPDALEEDLRREGQFPFAQRTEAYQEYFLRGAWHPAEREVRARAEVLGFHPWHGDTVLDLGTQTGGFLTYASARLAPPRHAEYVGLDVQPEYVDLARRLARANGLNICYRVMDAVRDHDRVFAWLWALWGHPPDHLLLLSMLKHLPDGEADVWALHDCYQPKHFYLETNAVKDGTHPDDLPLHAAVRARNGVLTGFSLDRNTRACYKVSRGR
jgi:SAM-dependent methyltransferase